MQILRRIILVSSCLLVFGFGCKGLSATQQAAIRPITLNYWTVFDNVSALNKVVSEYKAERPYVTINIRQVRYDEFDKLFVNALADDVAPDITSMHVRWLHKYQNRLSPMPASTKMGSLQVTNSITKDTQVVFDTFPLPTLDSIKRDYLGTVADDAIINKQVFGLPLTVDSLAIYYNKDLLDKAGFPEPPKDWTEFVEAVKRITKIDKDGTIIQSGTSLGTGKNIENSFDIVSALMLQNGVTMSGSSGGVSFSGGLDKNSPTHPALQALNFYTDFARPTKEVYSWNDSQSSAFDAFVRGKTAFYFGFAYDYDRIKSRAPDLNIEIMPLPQLNTTAPSNVANYWIQSVVKKSKNQNEAWDFIRFMSDPNRIKKYADTVHQPSALRIHVKAQQTDPIIAPFSAQILVAKNWYRGKDIDTAQSAFNTMISTVLKPLDDPKATDDDIYKKDASAVVRAGQTVSQTL